MTNLCKLHFDVSVWVHDENAVDLGKDLEWFIWEYLGEGDDVESVEFKGYNVVL